MITVVVPDDALTPSRSIGAAFARGSESVILVTADDIVLPDPTRRELEAALRNHPDAAVGCRICDPTYPARALAPGWMWFEDELQWRPRLCVDIGPEIDTADPVSCDWTNPEVIGFSVEMWRRVGQFDESLNLSMSIIDWCARARQLGFRCLQVQASAMAPASFGWFTGNRVACTLKDVLLFAKYHGLPRSHWRLAPALIAREILQTCTSVRFGANYGHPISLLQRTLWYLSNLYTGMRRSGLRDVVAALATRRQTPCGDRRQLARPAR